MPLSTRFPQGAAVRLQALPRPLLLPLAIGLLVRCGPSGPGSPTEAPDLPDPAGAPRLAAVSPEVAELRVRGDDPIEFHVEATSPRSLPLSITFLVDGDLRATASTFVFVPPAPGSYRVEAVVTDGELATTRAWTVIVDAAPPPNVPPTAVLGVEPGGGTAPLAVRFRVEGADPDGTVVRWRLEVVGPEPVIVEREAPIDTVLVLGAGDWQATAIVVDDAGSGTIVTRAIPVSSPNQPPVATLRVEPAIGAAPLDALVEGEGTDIDGAVARHRVDLDGDGAWDIDGAAPIRESVRFERPGSWWVRLAVTDDRGAEARDSVRVRVTEPPPPPPPPANAPPTASLSVTPSVGDAPLAVAAHAAGFDSDGTIAEVRIDFDGDGVPDAAGPGPVLAATFVFESPGTRTVRATIVDDDGATATDVATVTVRNASNLPPTGSLTLDGASGDAPLEVTITATGADPDGRIVGWEIEAYEGDGFVELDASRTRTLVYAFRESPYRPRLRLTDDAGATTVVVGPPVTVYRPIGGGIGSITGNPRFDATGIAPAVWSNGADPWRFRVTVVTPAGHPLPGVPLRAIPTRAPLSAPDGTPLGPGAAPGPGVLVTGGDGAAEGTLVTSLSTRIEEAPVIGFRPFDVLIEADAGHAEWRPVTRLEGLNANSTVSASTSRLILHPANVSVCPGTPVELEIQAFDRTDAPRPSSPTVGAYAELRYTDGSILRAAPLPGYGDWRTDGQGVIGFSYLPSRSDQSRLVQAWVDGQPIDELVVLALRPVSECGI